MVRIDYSPQFIRQLFKKNPNKSIFLIQQENNLALGPLYRGVRETFSDAQLKEIRKIGNTQRRRNGNKNLESRFGKGMDNPGKIKKFQDKGKRTCQEKYGAENPFAAACFKQEILKRSRESIFKKYGVTNVGKLPQSRSKQTRDKIHQTKKRNGTTRTSQPEIRCKKLASIKFPKTQFEFTDKARYPFHCDMYIPQIDTFVELQFHWTHGKEKFDPTNSKHLHILQQWKQKANVSERKFQGKGSFYETAISCWTIRDPKKRSVAKTNNLGYFEFFTQKDFVDWLGAR